MKRNKRKQALITGVLALLLAMSLCVNAFATGESLLPASQPAASSEAGSSLPASEPGSEAAPSSEAAASSEAEASSTAAASSEEAPASAVPPAGEAPALPEGPAALPEAAGEVPAAVVPQPAKAAPEPAAKAAAEEEPEGPVLAPQATQLHNTTITDFILKVDGVPKNENDSITITKNTQIYLRYDWKLEGPTQQINTGDWALLATLPKNLPLVIDLSQETFTVLDKTDNSTVIGIIGFVKNAQGQWEARLTYDEAIRGLGDISGFFDIDTKINFSSQEIVDGQIDFGGDYKYTIVFDDGNETDLNKVSDGKAYFRTDPTVFPTTTHERDKNTNAFNTLVWNLTVNTNKATVKDAVVQDKLTDGLSYHRFPAAHFADLAHIRGNVRVYPLHNDGTPDRTAPLIPTLTKAEADADNAGKFYVERVDDIRVNIHLSTSGKAITKGYFIEIASTVEWGEESSLHLRKSFMNYAQFSGKDKTGSIVAGGVKPVEKDGVIADDGNSVTWEIYINRGMVDYSSTSDPYAISLIDTLKGNQTFTLSDLGLTLAVKYPGDAGYANITGQAQIDTHLGAASLDPTNKILTISVKNINSRSYRITLKSHVGTGGTLGFNNTAEYTDTHHKRGDTEYLTGKTGGSDEFTVSKENTGKNGDKREAYWQTTIDPKGFRQLTLTDYINTGVDDQYITKNCTIALKASSVKVQYTKKNDPTPGSMYDMVTGHATISEYAGKQVGPTATVPTGQDRHLFKVVFDLDAFYTANAGVEIDKIYVTYTTLHTFPQKVVGQDIYEGGSFLNTNQLEAELDGDKIRHWGNDDVVFADKDILNGRKDGVYDKDTNRINWTVRFNTAKTTITGPIGFEDVFPDGVELYMPTAGDPYSGIEVFKDDVKINTGYTIVPRIAGDTSYKTGFTLTVNDTTPSNSEYRLEFATSLTGVRHNKYKNSVHMSLPGSNRFVTFEDEVTVPLAELPLYKEMAKKSGTDNIVESGLVINRPQHNLTQLVVTDTLCAGLVLDESSVEVYKILGWNGDTPQGTTKLQEGDAGTPGAIYKFQSDGMHSSNFTTTFTLTFHETKVDYAILVLYKATVDRLYAELGNTYNPSTGTYALYNNASFTSGEITSMVTKEVTQAFSTVSGAGGGEPVYYMQVKKVDASNTNTTLAGAKFELRNSGGQVLLTFETDSNGLSKVEPVLKGSYTLVETEAPNGYVLPTGNAAKLDVTVNRGTKASPYVVTRENTKQPSSSSVPASSSTPTSTPGSTPSSTPGSSSAPSSEPSSSSRPSSSRPSSSRPSSSSAVSSSTVTPPPPPASSTTPTRPRPPIVPAVASSSSAPTPPPAAAAATPPPADAGPGDGGDGADAGPVASVVSGSIVPGEGSGLLDSLLNGNIPLGGFGEGAAWSLLNLMMSLISLFAAIVLFVGILRRKRKQNEQGEDPDEFNETPPEEENDQPLRRRLMALRVPAILLGLVPGILFLLLENIRLPVTWITRWTPLIGAFFILHMVVVVVHFFVKKKRKDDEGGDDETPETQPA